jgi:uncharacterized protein YgfB (UPF0149 family)
MLELGKCVSCNKDFSLVSDNAVADGKDKLISSSSESRVSLLVSPLTFLLSLGWLTRGRKDEDWQDLLKRYAGENFREFVGSHVCPICFPSGDDESMDEDEDEDEDEEYSDDDPVLGLLIRADGHCEKISVSSVQEIREILGCATSDYYYDREFAIWIYLSENQSPRTKVNVYASSIANSFIPGDCVLLYDLDKEGNRVDHWTNMGDHWFDDVLFRMMHRCNNDTDAIKFLEKHRR